MEFSGKRMGAIILITALLLPTLIAITNDSSADQELFDTITPIDDPELPPWGFYKGLLPNPESGGDIAKTYENVSSFTQMVPVWGRPSTFYNFSTDLSGGWGDIFVDQLIRDNGMFPLVHMSFHGPGMTIISPSHLPSATLNDPDWRALYIQSAKDIVNASRPKYFSLGNEVNRWFETHGMNALDHDGFQHYISLYNETYDAVKALSPETKVFCTFSREMVEDNKEADLSILEHFDPDRMDVLVFTSYPFAVGGINRVADMGNDYYRKAFLHFEDKPFGLSEVTWTSDPAFGGEEEQSLFVSELFSNLTDDMEVEFLSWNWLHDLAPADKTGLKGLVGNERLAYSTWIDNSEPTYDPQSRMIDLYEDFGTYVYDLNQTFSDPDEMDTLTYSIWNGSDYTNITDTKVRAEIVDSNLVLTSIPDVNGITQLNIRVEDWSGLSNWTIIQVRIENVNDAPRVITGFPDPHRFAEGQSSYIDLSYYIKDPDHHFIQLSGKITGSPYLVATMDLSSSPYLVLYAMEDDWFGETYVHMNISDPEGGHLNANMSVSVTPVNDPPVKNTPLDITMDEDTDATYDLDDWFQDPEGDSITYQLNISDPGGIDLELNGTELKIIPRANWHGNAQLTINTTDGPSYVLATITIHVIPVNDAPVLRNISTIHIMEDQDIYLELSDLEPLDNDDDDLYWSISDISDHLWSVSLPSNDTIHIKPSVDRFGSANFTLVVEDGRGGSSENVIDVEIEPINDAPFFSVPPNWTVEIVPGGTYELDLGGEPYLVEDVDDPISELVVYSDYDLISFDGLYVNVSIPEDISSTELTITIGIRDPSGATSVQHEMLIKVMEIEDHLIDVDNITVTSVNGVVKIRVSGEPYQDIWAVLTDDQGTIGSYRLIETTPGSGSYELNIDDLELNEGEVLEVHLSTIEDGDNDSNLPGAPFTFQEKIDSGSEDPQSPLIYILAALLVLVIILMLFMIIRSRQAGRVSDFDYEALLEE